jgi:hypothetical protein
MTIKAVVSLKLLLRDAQRLNEVILDYTQLQPITNISVTATHLIDIVVNNCIVDRLAGFFFNGFNLLEFLPIVSCLIGLLTSFWYI